LAKHSGKSSSRIAMFPAASSIFMMRNKRTLFLAKPRRRRSSAGYWLA
jgi:hypothetical protein